MGYNYDKRYKKDFSGVTQPVTPEVTAGITEKQIAKDNDSKGLEPETKVQDKALEKEREGNADMHKGGTQITEKQLAKEQRVDNKALTTEAAMDKSPKVYNFKRNVESAPLMDYHKETEKVAADKFKKEQDKTATFTPTAEQGTPGEQMEGKPKKIVDNKQRSQLLSNFESREEFEKKASSILGDQDAVIYNAYKTASSEGREVNESEQNAIVEANRVKSAILHELYNK